MANRYHASTFVPLPVMREKNPRLDAEQRNLLRAYRDLPDELQRKVYARAARFECLIGRDLMAEVEQYWALQAL